MRFVIIGAGAVGGLLSARLYRHDNDVALVARGANYTALSQHGLRLEDPDGVDTVDVPVVSSVDEIEWRDDDVVVLAVKSQDTSGVLRSVARVAPSTVSVVCAQNGVENERVALRLFERVYAMCVICPSIHLEPGVVRVHASPVSGVMDVGRWPGSIDPVAVDVAERLERSGFISQARADIATLKWGKLLSNILNSLEALCGDIAPDSELATRARTEATDALDAGGIDSDAALTAINERFGLLRYGSVGEHVRGGGSSWQSLTRGTGDIESDYLNGEIVLLGRLHGVATPVNEMLARRANEAARDHRPPGSISERELLEDLG